MPVAGAGDDYMGPGARLTSKTNLIRCALINFLPVFCMLLGSYSTLIWFGEDYEYAVEQGYRPGFTETFLDTFGEQDIMFRIGCMSLVMTVLENLILMT